MQFLVKSRGAVGAIPAAGAAALGLALLATGSGGAASRSDAPAITIALDLDDAAAGRHRAEGAPEITIRLAMTTPSRAPMRLATRHAPVRTKAAPANPPAAAPAAASDAVDAFDERWAWFEPENPVDTEVAAAPVPKPKPIHVAALADHPSFSPPRARRGASRIALIIDDMGVDVRRSARMVSLPGPITLSYLPYAPHLKAQVKAARAAGHKLMVHVPMEPEGTVAQPGPKALDIGLTRAQILQRLDWALSRFDGYGGVNNHMGSRFTVDAELMRTVLVHLKQRGLFFVDSVTVHGSTGAQIAQSIGLPHTRRDVFLDHKPDDVPIEGRLRELEKIARANGVAVGIGHPRDATIAALKQWLPKARRAGFVFVPVAEVVHVDPPAAPQVARAPAGAPS